jgi:DNA-binding NtrC family response regulator
METYGKKKLFIVEDDFVYAYILESMLNKDESFKISSFSSGEDCVDMLVNEPDLIILDHCLEKGYDGIDTLKLIRAKKPKVPVIVLSGQKDLQVAADLLKIGACDYIVKGNSKESIDKLEVLIRKMLNN